MKFILATLSALVCIWAAVLGLADDTRGVLRQDLVGKYWSQLPPTQYPGFTLPLQWRTSKIYELRFFEQKFTSYIVAVTELTGNGKKNKDGVLIVSAIDFSTLKKGEIPEQDCFYSNVPSCEGKLCDGLLIGVIAEKEKNGGTYRPKEVWKITTKTLKFEKVSPKNVICQPQSYAE